MLKKLAKRRSVRKYTDEPVPEEKMKKILAAGLLSPTSKNLRPWEFLVVQDKNTLSRLAECRDKGADMLKGAAAAIIVMADQTINDVWIEDCSIAMSNMHLTAADEGIGSCWIQVRNRMSGMEGKSTEGFIRELFCLDEKFAVEAILSLGMPARERSALEIEDSLWDKIHYEKF